MPRKTLIFGNGLGMALDAEFFSLDGAMELVWNDPAILDEAQRELIRRCLPDDNDDRPRGEHDLDRLHLALSATDLLATFPGGGIGWLSQYGQEFPSAVRRFIYRTEARFHRYSRGLQDSFVDPLAAFIRNTNSHLATLNYDNLLYQPLIQRNVLRGYSGTLIDGFWETEGFAADHLDRHRPTLGYYLHLHGSPLFVDRDNQIKKLQEIELYFGPNTRVSFHIVLTHVRHKRTVIDASEVLREYWRRLQDALYESEEIMLFGYSGNDTHLNESLRAHAKNTSVRIVEWANPDINEATRQAFWNDALSGDVTLIRLEDILEFTDWEQ